MKNGCDRVTNIVCYVLNPNIRKLHTHKSLNLNQVIIHVKYLYLHVSTDRMYDTKHSLFNAFENDIYPFRLRFIKKCAF